MRRCVRHAAIVAAVVFLTLGAGWVCRAAEIRVEPLEPAPIRLTIAELPAPSPSTSADKPPRVVPPPRQPVLKAPAGFRINVFAEVRHARWLAVTPEGEVLCAASNANKIVLLEDRNSDGVAEGSSTFLDASNGANLPFGMAFHDGWFYLGNTNGVLRYPYRRAARDAGATGRLGQPERVTALPGRGYNQHWTRNVVVAPDGKKLYVSVGSATNVSPEEPPRASVLQMNLDGTDRKQYAFGLRNPVGLAFEPKTGELYATVNERDGLGDNLVPDYLARLCEGEFYGWPYAYLDPQHLDPRRQSNGRSERPQLVAKTRTPAVLFQSHSAALGLTFYTGKTFPEKYRDGAFVAFRGSWNRNQGTGYKIVFVPFDAQGRAKGWYEDFVTGFLMDPNGPTVWGRPVGVLVMPDGSLLFTEEGNGRIYRVQYAG